MPFVHKAITDQSVRLIVIDVYGNVFGLPIALTKYSYITYLRNV